MSVYRDDARLEFWAAVSHDERLRADGVVEPDELTEVSHALYVMRTRGAARSEFTADERLAIRLALGMAPFTVEGET